MRSHLFPSPRRRRVAALAALVLGSTLGLTSAPAPTSAYADTADSAVTTVHRRNLLRAGSFTDHGFAGVETHDSPEGGGDSELGACGMTAPSATAGYVNEKYRMYQGGDTYGEQVVVAFRTRRTAAAYVQAYRDAVSFCAAYTEDLVALSRVHRPGLAGVTSARWWSAHHDQGDTRSWGTVSLVRNGARVSVLVMWSVTSEPRNTMDVPALMQDMADRVPLR